MTRRKNLAAALHGEPPVVDEPTVSGGDGQPMPSPSTLETLPAQGRATRPAAPKLQGIGTDQFLYFFLRLRKGEVRRVVQRAQMLYPGESPEQLARRLVNTQSTLSFIGGALLQLPHLLPMAGSALKFAGFAGGASIMTRMHLYLILEIALLYGHDIDDQARVPEMMAIVAASGIAATAPFLVQALNWHRLAAIPTSGLTVLATTQLIGAAAIRHYSHRGRLGAQQAALPAPASA